MHFGSGIECKRKSNETYQEETREKISYKNEKVAQIKQILLKSSHKGLVLSTIYIHSCVVGESGTNLSPSDCFDTIYYI